MIGGPGVKIGLYKRRRRIGSSASAGAECRGRRGAWRFRGRSEGGRGDAARGRGGPGLADIERDEGDATPMPTTETWRIRELIEWTTEYFRKRGSESPRLEAEILLGHVLNYPRVKLYTQHDEEVGPEARERFRELVKRRGKGTPTAYLLGRKEFYSLELRVSPAVLIPRPDSEYAVVEFLSATRGLERVRAADVGTGSGCLAIAAAKWHPGATFVATDLSAEAIAVAEANAREHGVADRIEFRTGDLLEPAAGETFDAIVSNPPYIPSADVEGLEPDVRDHEPRLALDGGPDGLSVTRRLLESARGALRPGGTLVLEIGHDQEEAARALFAGSDWDLAATVRDLGGRPRVLRATRR